MRTRLSGAIVLLLLLCACAAVSGPHQGSAVARDYLSGDFGALAGEWVVSSIQGGPANAGAPITLSVNAKGEFAGSAGCNRYFGKFEPADGKLGSGPIGSTMMACEEALMQLEYLYLGLLPRVTGIASEDGRMFLLDQDSQTVLELSKPGH
jgi:putative lipoprotein